MLPAEGKKSELAGATRFSEAFGGKGKRSRLWEVLGYPISVFVFKPCHYYDFVAHLSWNWGEVVELAMAERILERAAEVCGDIVLIPEVFEMLLEDQE